MDKVNLIVIGAGPGGYETAARAAAMGCRVKLIEKGELGGTCLNRGCIPTKCLVASAAAATSARSASALGIDAGTVSVDYGRVRERMLEVVAGLRDGVAAQLADVEIIHGEASICPTGPGVTVNGEQIYADDLIIATGSTPARLPIPGAELALTSDDIPALKELPASIVIIGAGVIGMEYASILSALGTQVTVVEYCREILPPFDREVAKRLRMLMGRRGVKIVTDAKVTAIEQTADGLSVHYEAKGKPQSITAQTALMAVGRKPCIPAGCEEADIRTDRRGIIVDDNFMTSRDHIYAIGDVNGRCMLAHAATAQGAVVLGMDVNLEVMPADVFTDPELAMVGLTEEQCAERELHYRVRKALYASCGKARAMGQTDGFVKLITEVEGDAILGCHIIGAHASDLIGEVALAMQTGLTGADIAATIHAHPTLSELLPAVAH